MPAFFDIEEEEEGRLCRYCDRRIMEGKTFILDGQHHWMWWPEQVPVPGEPDWWDTRYDCAGSPDGEHRPLNFGLILKSLMETAHFHPPDQLTVCTDCELPIALLHGGWSDIYIGSDDTISDCGGFACRASGFKDPHRPPIDFLVDQLRALELELR